MDIIQKLERTMEDCISREELFQKIKSKKRLNIKYGVDVTAPFLHLGHAVNLWMMRDMQEQGHCVQFLIGDFTTLIGDPTGKSQTRPQVSKENIQKNALDFIQQVSKILITDDPSLFKVYYNSDWFSTMPLEKFLELLSLVTHSKLIARDMFQKRIKEESHIYMHEMIYPILQGYDSKVLESDLTIIGSDQLFNELMGRFFQEKFQQPPQVVMTSSITPGLDGVNKQSKSLNNYIAITDSSRDMFGKVLSLPDSLIILWMRVYTTISLQKIEDYSNDLKNGKNPRDLKIILAENLIQRYYPVEIAQQEKEWFLETFSKKSFPQDAPSFKLTPMSVLQCVFSLPLQISKSEIRRLFEQKSIQINNEKVLPDTILSLGSYELKIGKRIFYRITIE